MNSENQTMMERTKICSAEMGDRISLLPDELLHLILSYLNTKLAVQTCILSKRWRYLWIGISTLYLEGSSFSDDSSFMKFLNHVLLHRDHSKTICEFKISYSFENDSIEKLVHDFLVKHCRGIQDFFFNPNYYDLSYPFLYHLSWDSLKTLTLYSVLIPIEEDLDFVSLTTFHLMTCQLEIHNCYPLKKSFKIFAPQLKEFIMSYMYFTEDRPNFKFILYFPKLLSFSFEGCFLIDISFPHHLDLLKLSVDYRDYFAEGIEYKYFINMFGTIGSAKVVSISYAAIGALFNVPDVVKGKQSPLRGIEELKIIVQNRNTEVGNMFSFKKIASVLTYLLSRSPSFKRIMIVYSKSEVYYIE